MVRYFGVDVPTWIPGQHVRYADVLAVMYAVVEFRHGLRPAEELALVATQEQFA